MSIHELIPLLLPSGGSILSLESGPSVAAEEAGGAWPPGYQVIRRRVVPGGTGLPADEREPLPGLGRETDLSSDQPFAAVCYQRYSWIDGSPLDLINVVHGLLVPDGYFVCCIAREHRGGSSSRFLRRIDYFSAIAGRCGFSIVAPVPGPFDAGSGDRVLVLQKVARMPRWRLSLIDESELGNFLRLFSDSFGSELSPDLWRWKYSEGRGRAVVAKRGAALVAHYGSTLRTISYFGRPGVALQICDVMVDPRERGVMTKKGAMFMVTATYLEIHLGLQDFTIAYGFPNRRHMQLGERLGLYGEVARMVEVRWPAAVSKPRIRSGVSVFHELTAGVDHQVNRVWSQMRRDLEDAVVVVRDWEYIKYRYFSHPMRRYELFFVYHRLTRRTIGVLVLQKADGECELVDLVAPLKQLPLLVEQARRIAGGWGFSTLYCWITHHFAPHLAGSAGQVSALDVSVPTNTWVDGPAVEQLRGKWWLMSGDTEFR